MIPSLKQILARCEEYGDCLLWQGPFYENIPQVRHGARRIHVRRAVFNLSRPVELQAGEVPVMTCREARCLNAAHMVAMTRKELLCLASKEGKFAAPQVRAARIAGIRSGPHVKLDMVRAREIRESSDSAHALASAYGISASMVRSIKRGRYWVEMVRGASIFNL